MTTSTTSAINALQDLADTRAQDLPGGAVIGDRHGSITLLSAWDEAGMTRTIQVAIIEIEPGLTSVDTLAIAAIGEQYVRIDNHIGSTPNASTLDKALTAVLADVRAITPADLPTR